MRHARAFLVLIAMLAAAGPAAARHDPQKLPATRIRDLHYGDVLFYYFQGPDQDLEALTRLGAYEHWDRMPHHELDAQLLAGGLYLSLGLHNEAGARFAKLLTPNIPVGVRNRAWYYLAQVWYARGYLDKAEQALERVQGVLPVELEAEREQMSSNILIREGHYDAAVHLLEGLRGPPDWRAYARLNLGIALVREHRVADADPYLTAVGTLRSANPELVALRDRANLALGYAYLQANDPAKALTGLERVRLDGPYSDKALLGVGWAEASLGNYRSALVPWLALRQRSLADSAVQESYLAVPYAYGKLSANGQATESYESALSSYAAENQAIRRAIERIESGRMIDTLLANDEKGEQGWFWQLENLPKAPESRYLYAVFAGHDFQEGLKNYRDLGYMDRGLARWAQSMDAFANMIDTRERAYAERLPRVDALLHSGITDRMQKRRDALAARLDAIERQHDVAALGSPDERAHWAQIRRIESTLAALPPDATTAAMRERLRLVKGVLYFSMDEAFRARVWEQRRTIKDLDLALNEAQERWIRVERARNSVPTNTGDFAKRVEALRERITDLRTRMAANRLAQRQYLARIAVSTLAAERDRLAAYEVQARFELASMYDRAADQADNAPARPSGAAAPPSPAPAAGGAAQPEPHP